MTITPVLPQRGWKALPTAPGGDFNQEELPSEGGRWLPLVPLVPLDWRLCPNGSWSRKDLAWVPEEGKGDPSGSSGPGFWLLLSGAAIFAASHPLITTETPQTCPPCPLVHPSCWPLFPGVCLVVSVPLLSCSGRVSPGGGSPVLLSFVDSICPHRASPPVTTALCLKTEPVHLPVSWIPFSLGNILMSALERGCTDPSVLCRKLYRW